MLLVEVALSMEITHPVAAANPLGPFPLGLIFFFKKKKTAYWANIGRVVFGASNDRLMELTGAGNGENFTMRWRCAEVIGGGQKEVEVVGPLAGWEDKVSEDADLYWAEVRRR